MDLKKRMNEHFFSISSEPDAVEEFLLGFSDEKGASFQFGGSFSPECGAIHSI